MERITYDLPSKWSWVPLGDVATLLNGRAYKQAELLDSGPTPVLRVGNFFSNRSWYYSDLDLPEEKYCEEGDLLYAWSASFGPKIWKGPRAIYHYHIWKILISEQIDKKFLFYLLEKDSEDIKAQGNGVGMFHATKGGMEKMLIPLPPMSEQKLIVEKLDAVLTRIDTAIEHLHSKLDLSKQLFDSILDEFFKLPECDAVPLTEVVDFIGGSQPPKSQFSDIQKEGYVRLIQIRDYKSDNYIVYVDSASTKKFCTKDDVMIGRYGPPVFQILRGLDGAYNVALMKAVPNEDVLTKDYLFWFLQSPSIQNYVIGISQRAAGQSGVNKKALEKYLIPVPSKTMQNNIVDKVGQLVSKSRDLEAEVTAEIASLNQLKASILDSAFKGEL